MKKSSRRFRLFAGGLFARNIRPLAASLAVLSVCLLSPPAFAAPEAVAAAAKKSVNATTKTPPVTWKLTPKAEHMYHFLLFEEALKDNDQPLALESLRSMLKVDPDLSTFQYGVTVLLTQGDFTAAQEIAAQGLSRYPDDQILTIFLAGALSEVGEIKKAIDLLEKHTKKFATSMEARQELVRLYVKTDQLDKARKILAQFPDKNDGGASQFFKAKVLASTGKIKEAREIINLLLEKNPDFVDAWIELGGIEETDKNLPEAIKAYEKAAALSPESLEIWFRVINLQLELKKTGDAVETANKVTEPARFRLQAALIFADKGYNREAETLLEQARISGANPDEAAYYLSIVRFRLTRDPKAAGEALNVIDPASPFYPRVIQKKIQFYIDAQDFATAQAESAKAREKFPYMRELWTMESYALSKQGKNPEAKALLLEGLAKNPDDAELMLSLGHIMDELGEKAEAIRIMEKIIAKDPSNARALNYVGYSLAEQNKDLQRALKLITRAHDISPDADYIVDSLAWVQYRLGQYGKAWETIQRCIVMGAEDATIWEHYGDIARALKKTDEAVKGYTEALKRKPINAADIQKRLKAVEKK